MLADIATMSHAAFVNAYGNGATAPPSTPFQTENHCSMVRIKPTAENLAIMVDIFCAIIETGILPSVNSPVHHTARWLVDDTGHKPKRIRSRLKHRKPKVIT